LIFLVSLPRSGSTLLQHVIAGHPSVGSTAEPWILLAPVYALRESAAQFEYGSRAGRVGLKEFLERIEGGEDRYYAAVRHMALELYRAFLEQHKKERFLDKTSRYYLALPEIVRMFPDARYVFLVRHPLGMLASYLDVMIQGDWRTLSSVPIRNDLLYGYTLLRRGVRYFGDDAMLVRYEDLVQAPEQTVKRLCQRLGLEYVPSMLDYGVGGVLPGRLVDPKSIRKHQRPVADYVDTWRTAFRSAREVELAHAFIAHLGRPLVEGFGYELDELQSALSPLAGGRRLEDLLADTGRGDTGRPPMSPMRAVRRRARRLWHEARAAVRRRRPPLEAVSPSGAGSDVPVSARHRLVAGAEIPLAARTGWRTGEVAERQAQAYRPLLSQMLQGDVRRDFAVAAESLRLLALENPTIVEIGCGNGYYSEILAHLYRRPFRYVGVDYSAAMTRSARTAYPGLAVVVADALTLPFRDRAFDVAWSGTVLMHLPDYVSAVRETCRVARRFCVFHSVPVRLGGPTVFLTKTAYGATVAEVIVNRTELERCLRRNRLAIRHVLESLPYDPGGLADDVDTLTYVCERSA
jgi:SAM-dependent methyltransferase